MVTFKITIEIDMDIDAVDLETAVKQAKRRIQAVKYDTMRIVIKD